MMNDKTDKARILSFTKDDDAQPNAFDIYDPKNYDVDESEASPAAEHKLKVRLRRPHSTVFVRAADSGYFRFKTNLLRFEDKEDVYNVVPSLWADLEEDLTTVDVFLFIDRDGSFYLWNIPRDSEMDWHKSARRAVEAARQHWIRIVPDMSEGEYRIVRARAALEDPDWPTLQPRDFLEAGFKGRTITTLEHEAVDRLRGGR
jgi:hypothetical protein